MNYVYYLEAKIGNKQVKENCCQSNTNKRTEENKTITTSGERIKQILVILVIY